MSFRKGELITKEEDIIEMPNNVDVLNKTINNTLESNVANDVLEDDKNNVSNDPSINPQINENLIKIIENIVAKYLQKQNTYKRPINYAKELKLLSQRNTNPKAKLKIKNKFENKPKIIRKLKSNIIAKLEPKINKNWIYVRR